MRHSIFSSVLIGAQLRDYLWKHISDVMPIQVAMVQSSNSLSCRIYIGDSLRNIILNSFLSSWDKYAQILKKPIKLPFYALVDLLTSKLIRSKLVS